MKENWEITVSSATCFLKEARRGQLSRNCIKKKPCTKCSLRHVTLLPDVSHDLPKREDSIDGGQNPSQSDVTKIPNQLRLTGDESSGANDFCGLTTMEGPKTSLPIVAIKVKARGSPYCIETDALLDAGSNSTSCSSELLDCLGVQENKVSLKQTAMNRTNDVEHHFNGLAISDWDENIAIPLHKVYSRPMMPHLRGLVQLVGLDSHLDLLIGSLFWRS